MANQLILTRPSSQQRLFFRGAILLAILLATWLRLWQFPDVPYGLEYDEATKGLDVLYMLQTGAFYLFSPSNNGREALFFYPIALSVSLLGFTPFALRFTSVWVGIMAVPLLYRLTLALFRPQPQRHWLALIAAASLALSFWHIAMSRVALRVVLIPTFFPLVAWLFWRGWEAARTAGKKGGADRYFIAAGVALGLSQYAYLSARFFPVVFLLTQVAT